MAIIGEDVRYDCDGTAMHGRLYRDDALPGPRPAVLVHPDALGIGPHCHAVAERLAGLGYIALACDLHGAGYRGAMTDPEIGRRIAAFIGDTAKFRQVGSSALAFLAARAEVDAAKVAAIGYCFGGALVLEMAFAGEPIVAAVAFHPSIERLTLADAAQAKARLLVCLGTQDPWAPAEARARLEPALTGSGVWWRMHLYGGVAHSFTNPEADDVPAGIAYDAAADRESWSAMTALLAEAFAD